MTHTQPKFIVESFSKAAERVPEIKAMRDLRFSDPACAEVFSAVESIAGYEIAFFIPGVGGTESTFVFRRKHAAIAEKGEK